MTFRIETISDAREAARTAVAYLDEEERWGLLQKWLAKETAGNAKETAGKRKATRRSFRLEALRSIVCPRVKDREWDKIVREHRPARWADELRLANALAIERAGSLGQPSREAAKVS
jgi:hypothetical protein